ncbi:MAG: protein kinase [Rhodobacterales bacterium]|nr:protein kinase [Rhodobacterales bacterium]
MRVEPGTVVDRYAFQSLLGRGGMAAVYLAQHTTLGSLHAIKVLTLPTPAIQQRLLQEGRAQGTLKHVNIVTATDVIEVGGSPGLVMEYVDGPSLQQLLGHESLSLVQADDLARGILRGVAAAHRHGLIHRDLKPGNVLLAFTEDGLQAKITDFGLAKVVLGGRHGGGIQTRSGLPLGTPSYMAPEQIKDAANVDQRADVWAIGCILYELVSGHRAFSGDDLIDTYRRVRDNDRLPIRHWVADLPKRMEAAIEGAIVTNPSLRIADVEALRTIWQGGDPVSAGPVSAWDAAVVQRARQLALAELMSAERPKGPTFMGEVPAESSETWVDPRLGETGPSRASLPSPVDHSRRAAVTLVALEESPPTARFRGLSPWFGVAVVVSLALSVGVGRMDFGSAEPVFVEAVSEPVPVLTSTSVSALFQDPQSQEQLERGWSALVNGDFEEALRRLQLVVEAQPDSPTAWLVYGRALRYSGQRGPAIEALWTAVDVAGSSDDHYAQLARIMGDARRESWSSEQGNLLAFLDAHPNDYLAHLLVLSTVPTTDAEGTWLLFDRTRKLDDRVVIIDWLQAQRHLEVQEFDAAEKALRVGLANSPRTPTLLIGLGDVLMHRGRFDEARDALLLALKGAPGNGLARTHLASAWLMLGQEDDVGRTTLQMMTSPTPFSQQARYSRMLAMTLVGEGRMFEASELLQRTAKAAVANGEFTSALVLEGAVANLYQDADMVLPMVASSQRLVALSHMPEVPDTEREQLVRNLLYAQGVSAVRMGQLEEGEATLGRLKALDRVWPVYVEYLEREIAIAKSQPERVLALTETISEGCLGDLEVAQAGYRAGGHPQVRTLLEHRLANPEDCSQVGAGRFALAKAHVTLAEILRTEGEVDLAETHLRAFKALWTRPDGDIPLVQRAK